MAQNDNQTPKTDRTAAADVIRDDIDRIFTGDDAPHKEAEDAIRAEQDKATRADAILTEQKVQTQATSHVTLPEDWKRYHTSWQSYYQQYYERYYLNHLHKTKQTTTQVSTQKPGIIASYEPEETDEEQKAIQELRDKLLGTVKTRAKEVRKSRHYAPIMTGVVFALVFLFLQYNRFLFATVQAYVSPGSIDSQNIIVDPSTVTKVGPEPKLIIPKINVEAPVIYGVNSADDSAVQENLKSGVVHYPIANAASAPGQNGATVILGHSSNDVFDSGNYKFVFVQLSKLENGDSFYINYQGTRYTYSVTKKEIISPTDIAKVTADPSKPSVILITCEPPGTALQRLLIFADQISPDPKEAIKTSGTKKPNKTNSITGNSPTFIERLFGAN